MNETRDLRHEMANAILEAIIEINRLPGAPEAHVVPLDALQALIVATAALVEADPDMTTPKAIREYSEAIGKQLYRQIRLFRDQYDKTGMRAWEPRPVGTQ